MENGNVKDPLLYIIFTTINKEIEKHRNHKDEYHRVLYEGFIRARKLLMSIDLHGIQEVGITYEEFAKQLDNKHNVILMSDEELLEYKFLMEMQNVIKERLRDEVDK